MALHVPRAPGFASMLKDGARVSLNIVSACGRPESVVQGGGVRGGVAAAAVVDT